MHEFVSWSLIPWQLTIVAPRQIPWLHHRLHDRLSRLPPRLVHKWNLLSNAGIELLGWGIGSKRGIPWHSCTTSFVMWWVNQSPLLALCKADLGFPEKIVPTKINFAIVVSFWMLVLFNLSGGCWVWGRKVTRLRRTGREQGGLQGRWADDPCNPWGVQPSDVEYLPPRKHFLNGCTYKQTYLKHLQSFWGPYEIGIL